MTSDSGEADESGSVESGSTQGVGSRTLAGRLAWLVLLEFALAAVVVPVAYFMGLDLRHVLIAWLVCFVGTIAAHVASEFPKGVEFVLLRMASGMACRMIFPMGFAIWGKKFSDPPVESPVILVLALFFLAGLVADSYLGLERLKQAGSQ